MTHFRTFDETKPNKATKIFFGESSGVRDYDDIRYPEALQYSKDFFGEYWVEDEIKLGKDVEEYREKLNDRERYVFNILTGMLNTLDSIATDFNNVLNMLCTEPSIRSCLALITSFEQLHNRSYQYLTSTMLNQQEKTQAFEEVNHLEKLLKRNKHITTKIEHMNKMIKLKLCEDVLPDKVDEKEVIQAIFEGLTAYLLLEGLYFSGGFVYFHSLARDQKMLGSNNMITLIKTDENQHSEFFGFLYQATMKEYPYLNTKENLDFAIETIIEGVRLEKEWSEFIFEGITTMSIKEYHNYVEYLANLICRNAGLPEPYPDNNTLKSKWISTYGSKKRSGGENEIVTRQDFLQTDAINYQHEGGEDFDL